MAGFLNSLLALIGQNPTPTGAQQNTAAAAFPGTDPSQFTGFGPSAPSSNPLASVGNAASAATNPSDPSSLASLIGSAPRSSVGTGGTGFLGGLTSLLTNPLTQAAADAYFTAVSQPRDTKLSGRIGMGGLAGMKGLEEGERQAQFGDPMLQQLLLQAQQQTELGKRRLAPIPQEALDQLDQYRDSLKQELANPKIDESERAIAQQNLMHVSVLEAQTKAKLIDPEHFQTAIDAFDSSKQQLTEAKASQEVLKAQMESQMMQMFGPVFAELGIKLPQTPSTSGGETPATTVDKGGGGEDPLASGIPASGAIPATSYPTGFKPTHDNTGVGYTNMGKLTDGSGRYAIESGGKWLVQDGKGGWTDYNAPAAAAPATGSKKKSAPATASAGVDVLPFTPKNPPVKATDGFLYAQDPTTSKWWKKPITGGKWQQTT
jgi:hypothetical protein